MNAKHFVLGALVIAAPALAQQRDEQQQMQAGKMEKMEKLPRADMDLLKKLHKVNREEIELGQVAQEQSTRDDVKQFGKMMVDDHKAADEKITAMADQHGVQLAEESGLMKMADKFRKKTGNEFDKDYLSREVKDHDKTISEINSKQKKVTSDFQTTLTDLLPTLQKHRTEAKRLLDEVKGSRTASARTKAQGRTSRGR